MFLARAISSSTEPVLEKWARLLRFEASKKYLAYLLKTRQQVRIIDIGCGMDTHFYTYMKLRFPHDWQRIQYIGLDPLVTKMEQQQSGVKIYTHAFESLSANNISLPKADLVTLFAVLEHVDDEAALLGLALSLLKANGVVFATTPSHLAQRVLEVCAFGLGIISVREIAEHKRYFNEDNLRVLFKAVNRQLRYQFSMVHGYFELGLNNSVFIHR